MSFLNSQANDLRAPETLVLPDGRKRLTRFYKIAHTGILPPDLDLPYGTLYPSDAVAPPGWDGIRLVNKLLTDDIAPEGKPTRPMCQFVFEQIPESAEIQVGGNTRKQLQDGRTVVVADSLQFSTGTFAPQTVGTSTAPGDTSAYLMTEEAPDDGCLRRITRTYTHEGIIATDLQTENDGALLIQEITSVKTVPSTPSGYTLVGQPTQYPNGLPVYVYKFAKGNGQVSSDTEFIESPDLGTTGVTRTTIVYLTAPSVNSDPTTGPGGSVKVKGTKEDSKGHRVWTSIYASGQGTVTSSIEKRNNGKLIVYSITALGTAPSAPAPTISGTVVNTKSATRNGARTQDGCVVYDYEWAEGVGLVSQAIKIRTDGLREQTYISIGTKQTPTGVVISAESEEIDGNTKYIVTAMQTAAGATPTGATLVLPVTAPFTYPGRAKRWTATAANGWTIIDVFLDPPVETEIDATITITYQTSASLGSIGTRWQPTQGATIRAEWIGLNNIPAYKVQALRGYRSTDASALSVAVSVIGGNPGGTMLGNVIFGGTTAIVTVTGGPPDPAGNTYTLEAKLDLAFVDVSGTNYYRKTVISATIPAQAALPV